MKKINWDIEYTSPPPAIKYCKKCGKKTEYISSGFFRINAQRKHLDIWLIYKCLTCDSTWNMTIHSRINPKSISTEILDAFHNNNEKLVKRYAMDTNLMRKNGVEVGLPSYKIIGDTIDMSIPVELHIKSSYPSRLKVSSLLREKLNLSQNAFEELLSNGTIRSIDDEVDLKKCRLQQKIILIIDKWTDKSQSALNLAL